MIELDALMAEHDSPLWLVDLDRVRANWSAFGAAWRGVWADVEIAYSYKTNRLPAILRALAAQGALPEVVCEAELLLAEAVAGPLNGRAIVNGPVKPAALLERAARAGALVVADSAQELDRIAAAGVRRAGVRVALAGDDREPTRFGVAPDEVPAAVARARALGLQAEALSAHLVSTRFRRRLADSPSLGAAVEVRWPGPPHEHATAAAVLGRLAARLEVPVVDLGGGFPPAPAVRDHADAVARALDGASFAGRLALEPGRAIVADAVDLACTVGAVKRLRDGRRCVIVDAGTNLVPGALWGRPRIEAQGPPAGPALVTGPLCLNVDVLHPAVELPDLAPGAAVVIRAVGAYHQAQSTQFGDLRPATVAFEDGGWHLCRRRETVDDLLAGDLGPVGVTAAAVAGNEEGKA